MSDSAALTDRSIGLPGRPRWPLRRGASDEHLARALAHGREEAFAELYRRHHQALYRYCHSILRDAEDAQDALQSAMAKALVALRRQEREIAVRPWLFRIAHNEAIDLLRRRRTQSLHAEQLALQAQSAQSVAPEQALEQRERIATLLADLGALAERQRAALLMRELSGLSVQEIAGALAITPGAAKQALFEARGALREQVEGRAMDCQSIRRLMDEHDGRVLRGRLVRSHLRSCASCRELERSIASRRTDLMALAPPLPAATGAAILSRLLAGAGAGATHGAAAATGAAAGGASAGATGASVVGGAGAGAGAAGAGASAGVLGGSVAAKVAVGAAIAALAAGGAAHVIAGGRAAAGGHRALSPSRASRGVRAATSAGAPRHGARAASGATGDASTRAAVSTGNGGSHGAGGGAGVTPIGSRPGRPAATPGAHKLGAGLGAGASQPGRGRTRPAHARRPASTVAPGGRRSASSKGSRSGRAWHGAKPHQDRSGSRSGAHHGASTTTGVSKSTSAGESAPRSSSRSREAKADRHGNAAESSRTSVTTTSASSTASGSAHRH